MNSNCFAAAKTCDALLNECIAVVHDADDSISNCSKHVDLLNEESKRLQQSLDIELEKSAQAEAWYRDPKYVLPTVFILGFITAVQAERH